MIEQPKFHLYPPKGWLNDPNGLCQHKGVHHTFFQYSPDNPRGADKYWGHYETKDFLNYNYTGILLKPDIAADKNGVFSGSAITVDDDIVMFYTGNVEWGDTDRVLEGREGNTIMSTTKDGITHTEKKVVLKAVNYPDRLSCHVRDPKVLKAEDAYYMVLGGRTKTDEGLVMLYTSKDLSRWDFVKYIEPSDSFGFMWECPDLFYLDGRPVLSLSPQGLKSSEYKYQNPHQSGYFTDEMLAGVLGKKDEETVVINPETFHEWDMGFDFYAPQTYEDENGRRILIGWMGGPDVAYDHDPSIDTGWQHMLTVPRELSWTEDGRIRQWPVSEMDKLRGDLLWSKAQPFIANYELPELYELLIEKIISKEFSLRLDCALNLKYNEEQRVIEIFYESLGYGRDIRRIKLMPGEALTDLRLLVDNNCLEIFINKGAYTFSTKLFYDSTKSRSIEITGGFCMAKCMELKPLNISFLGE